MDSAGCWYCFSAGGYEDGAFVFVKRHCSRLLKMILYDNQIKGSYQILI
jgi:hypothetical protein